MAGDERRVPEGDEEADDSYERARAERLSRFEPDWSVHGSRASDWPIGSAPVESPAQTAPVEALSADEPVPPLREPETEPAGRTDGGRTDGERQTRRGLRLLPARRLRLVSRHPSVRRALMLSWVPLTAALLSLILSVASIYISTRQPEVLMILPDVVRLAGGHQTGASYVYLQPAFVSTGNNDRVEVIRAMRLTAQAASGGQSVELSWIEQIQLVSGTDGGGLAYRHVADAVPLLVSSKTAATPICVYRARPGWFLQADTYRFTLTADRVVASDALVGSLSVTVRPEDLAVLNAVPEQFLTYPVAASQ